MQAAIPNLHVFVGSCLSWKMWALHEFGPLAAAPFLPLWVHRLPQDLTKYEWREKWACISNAVILEGVFWTERVKMVIPLSEYVTLGVRSSTSPARSCSWLLRDPVSTLKTSGTVSSDVVVVAVLCRWLAASLWLLMRSSSLLRACLPGSPTEDSKE